MKLQLFVAQ